jgi:hypothetical protein
MYHSYLLPLFVLLALIVALAFGGSYNMAPCC